VPTFVVQEHEAERAGLHYDFRLESEDGVAMDSWAIRKGPPVESGIKRLAIEVEPHPIEYKTFQGRIPEGYGKGEVSIWDEGEYIPEGSEGGDTRYFFLNGDKLKGHYILKHWEGNKWLLWKR
jgi:bifunctional non-homologous end joining protein LigD